MEQRSQEWFDARLGRVTASRISDVMMKPDAAGYQNYLAQLVCERLSGNSADTGFVSAAMQHGIDTEPQAQAVYELTTGNQVEEVAFVQHPTLMAGASPDGLIGADGGLELKCPQPAEHIRMLTGGAIKRQYLLQMQWGMECTKREWWDFATFCPTLPSEMQLCIRRVPFDAEAAANITQAVTTFLTKVEAGVVDLRSRFPRAA
ncbi:MAG: lambda exonuclease family protein [Pseudomonadota bacterium]